VGGGNGPFESKVSGAAQCTKGHLGLYADIERWFEDPLQAVFRPCARLGGVHTVSSFQPFVRRAALGTHSFDDNFHFEFLARKSGLATCACRRLAVRHPCVPDRVHFIKVTHV